MKSGTKLIAITLAWLGSALAICLAAQILAPAAFAESNPTVGLECSIAREQVEGDIKPSSSSTYRNGRVRNIDSIFKEIACVITLRSRLSGWRCRFWR
jgi:hypothetical protein